MSYEMIIWKFILLSYMDAIMVLLGKDINDIFEDTSINFVIRCLVMTNGAYTIV